MLTSFHNFNNADNFTHNLLNKYYLNIKSNLHILIILLHCWIILSHNIVACEIRICGLVINTIILADRWLSVHSFETKDRLRIQITDSDHRRWEIPQDIIPRQAHSPGHRSLPETPSSPPNSHSLSDPNSYFLSDPNSDLILTLHTTSPFTFSITRKSTDRKSVV